MKRQIAVTKFETSSFPVQITSKKAAREEIGWHQHKLARWASCAGVASFHRRIVNALAGLL